MKSWLPHLIYGCLLLGGGLLLWRTMQQADERIAFLTPSAPQAYGLLAAENRDLLLTIKRTRKKYPSPFNEVIWRRTQLADSLRRDFFFQHLLRKSKSPAERLPSL